MLNPIAGGKWMVSLFESGGVQPPTDHEAFLRAAGALRHPILRQVIERATPLGPVYTSRHTENRRRHYEKLRRWPDQFLVIGDALVTLNPSYGHGMSVAVQSALLLDSMLRSHGTTVGISYRLRHALAGQVEAAWRIATASDLKHPCARGRSRPARPPGSAGGTSTGSRRSLRQTGRRPPSPSNSASCSSPRRRPYGPECSRRRCSADAAPYRPIRPVRPTATLTDAGAGRYCPRRWSGPPTPAWSAYDPPAPQRNGLLPPSRPLPRPRTARSGEREEDPMTPTVHNGPPAASTTVERKPVIVNPGSPCSMSVTRAGRWSSSPGLSASS
ncbi:hypothetical protein NKH18_35710 [Streptomyces sp. M10(2022)]